MVSVGHRDKQVRSLNMRAVVSRVFSLALLVVIVMAAIFTMLLIEYGIPFRIDPASGWTSANGSPYSFTLAAYLLLVCSIIAIVQSLVAWWLVRRPAAIVATATEFVGALPYRYGGRIELPHSEFAEMNSLIHALNATSQRLEIQDDALASLELRLKAVVDAMPEMVFFKNTQGCFLVCNKAYAGFIERPEREIVGYDEGDLVNTAMAEAHRTLETEVLRSGVTHVSRTWSQRSDGEHRLIETSRSLLCSHDGSVLGLLGVGRDITQEVRKLKAEHAHTRIFQLLAGGASLSEVLNQVVLYIEGMQPGLHCLVLTSNQRGDRLDVAAAPTLPAALVDCYRGLAVNNPQSCCAAAARSLMRTVVQDMANHPFWQGKSELLQSSGVGCCWAEPVLSAQHKMLGVIMVMRANNDAIADNALTPLVAEAASLASIAIERCHHEDSLGLAAMVYSTSNEAIFVMDSNDKVIAVNPAFEKITGYAAAEVIDQPCKMLNSERGSPDLAGEIQQALSAIGTWQGEVWNRRKSDDLFACHLTITTTGTNQTGRAAEQHRVGLFTDITERKRSEEIIWFQANNDALTGLPNRRLFRDRLEQDIARAQRAGQRVGLLFIDLDNFKQVNDVMGHEAGDLLLVEAARRLRNCVRGADTVARLGGDEFTVALPNFGNVVTVERICKSILARLSEPFDLNGETAYISASIGVTQYPDDAQDIEGLLKNADQSMYVAKEQGRNSFAWFTAALRDSAREWHALANDLRLALANDEFEVYFQPIIDFHTQLPVKAEALIRWHHPSRGMVSPAIFIPIAEEIGLIGEIGDWVFRESIRQASAWPLVMGQPVAVSINKSPRQFMQADASEDWIEYLRQVEFEPSRLVVEITEGLLMDERANIGAQLMALRNAGAKIAIDDFGTGYSSLSYLKKFPIDFIKIDKSFVRDVSVDINDRALCEAIIAIANLLGMQVVAEGVETEEQREFLYNAGGDFGQGYLFAKPMPGDEFVRFLSMPRLVSAQAA